MSIKEKAEEINSETKGGEGGSEATFFLLDTPGKTSLNSVFSPMVSGLIAGVLVITGIGSYALGNYAGKSSAIPAAMMPVEGEVRISRTVQEDIGNESKSASSTRVEGTGELQAAAAVMATQGAYVGSRKGTKYHLPWCPGACAIGDVNKIWFESKGDAEAAGYTPAANCKGL